MIFAPLLGSMNDSLASMVRWLRADIAREMVEGSRLEWEWSFLPTGLGGLAFVAAIGLACYAVFALYRKENDTCPAAIKKLLAVLRLGVLGLLLLVLLGPGVVFVQNRQVLPGMQLVRDASQSMQVVDRYADKDLADAEKAELGLSATQLQEGVSRETIVNRVFQPHAAWLAELQKKGELTLADFTDEYRIVRRDLPAAQVGPKEPSPSPEDPQKATESLPPLVAAGQGTDLAIAIDEALAADSPSAMFLFTDGQHHGNRDPRAAAREAKRRGMPIYVVGIGDARRPKNARVSQFYVRPQVWQGEPFEVEATISAEQVGDEPLRVELLERKVVPGQSVTAAAGTELGRVVASQNVTIGEGDQGTGQTTVRFTNTTQETGTAVYTLRVQPVDGELTLDDNQRESTAIKILSRQQLRVLLISGSPSWDFRLVQKLLARDSSLVVSCWLQTLDEDRAQDGTRVISRLPNTREELFWYDVIVMMDPNPQEFDREWLELLTQFVDQHAGGFLYMAGPKYTNSWLTMARTSGLAKVLPVQFGDVAALEVASLLAGSQKPWPLAVVDANSAHPAIRFFAEESKSQTRLETLPGIFWSFPCEKPKPTAQVLLEHSDPALRGLEGPRPLLVAGRLGAGHTLYMGFQGTWRWRKAGSEAEFFDKFWIQVVRYLVEGRALEGKRHGDLTTERERCVLGERVAVTANLLDSSYQPLNIPKLQVEVVTGGEVQENLTLMPVPGQLGKYSGLLVAKKPGVFLLRTNGADLAGLGVDSLEVPLTVEVPSQETGQVWLNEPLLQEVASLSGGQYFRWNEVNRIPAVVADKTETFEVRSRPFPLWDSSFMLFGIVGLLGIEWALRKRFELL